MCIISFPSLLFASIYITRSLSKSFLYNYLHGQFPFLIFSLNYPYLSFRFLFFSLQLPLYLFSFHSHLFTTIKKLISVSVFSLQRSIYLVSIHILPYAVIIFYPIYFSMIFFITYRIYNFYICTIISFLILLFTNSIFRCSSPFLSNKTLKTDDKNLV